MNQSLSTLDWSVANQAIGQTLNDDALKETSAYYLRKAYSENTFEGYRSSLIHFIRWTGHPDPFPTTPEMVRHYLISFANTLSPSTLNHRLAAISFVHRLREYRDPTDDQIVKSVMRGIRRDRVDKGWIPAQAKTFDLPQARRMLGQMSDSVRDIRDKAFLLAGLVGAFRTRELTRLHTDQIHEFEKGLVISLGKTKNDQLNKVKKYKVLPAIDDHPLCPVRALKAWLNILDREGYVFTGINRHGDVGISPVTHPTANAIVKKWVKTFDHEAIDSYSCNSLRASFITIARQLHIPDPIIAKQTLHMDLSTLNIYDRPEIAIENSPASAFMAAFADSR